jgi:N-methylhydantoinase A
VTDADLVLGRLDPVGFWGGRAPLDADGAARALTALGETLAMTAEEVAIAVVRLVDAHMADAVRRVLSLAGADPRRLDLCAFGGMGAVHATTQAAALGMRRVLVPRAAPGFSALGLVSADHVVDAMRSYLVDWRSADLTHLNALADELESAARSELTKAGVPDDRMRLEWRLNLVYPGQTFDNALPLGRSDDAPISAADVEACVEEFHRRNEAARLIEARSQEPMVRGIRLVATGLVDAPARVALEPSTEAPVPVGNRRVHVGDDWHDAAVYDGDALRPGPPGSDNRITGPAVVQHPFTTLVLRPGDAALMQPNGDVVVDVAP